MIHVASSARISEKHQNRLRQEFSDVQFSFFEEIQGVLQVASDAEILITYGDDLDEEKVNDFPELRWIHVISAGVELLPFAALKNRSIQVTNARGIHEIPMGEHAVAVILQWTRRLHQYLDRQRQGEWDSSLHVEELSGKTVSILGTGAIGRGIAARLKAFGVRVLGMNTDGRPHPLFDEIVAPHDLERLLKVSDFVVVTLPLTSHTQGLIGARELAWMKPTACLINMGRGAVVDEAALLNALAEESIGGAILDVFEKEPLPKDHPFWSQKNVLITPHVSGRSPLYMSRALDLFSHNMKVYTSGKGEVINLLDPEREY
ncbi:phosphoglycerate dehydrogenase-like enzyme [Kroppenstedtia sanguinis]|uniref:D-2-hydroxyacid dehydrogenase n=1 Tax=Kroppenstedtia sanguinis TaxID=1380684 RepID=UPI003D1C836B